MRIYHHDDNGILLAIGKADSNPLEAGGWLIPAKAVTIEPPEVPDGMRARWQGGAWSLEAIPKPEPEPPAPTAAEIRKGEIFAALAGLDQKSIRPLREGDAVRVAALEAEAAAMRAELRAL